MPKVHTRNLLLLLIFRNFCGRFFCNKLAILCCLGNALAAWYLFGESLTALKLTGIGFIVVGVFLVARGG